MVVRHFLLKSGRDVTCLYYHHGTPHADMALSFLEGSVGSSLVVGHIDRAVPKGASKEAFWRQERYKFLDKFNDKRVITCHHLDDQIETFLQGITHGNCDRSIRPQIGNYIRPFIRVPKNSIINYANRHDVRFVVDPSNMDNQHTRNRIRNIVIPELIKANPGLYKSMDNMFQAKYDQG